MTKDTSLNHNSNSACEKVAGRSAPIWGEGLGLTEKQERFAQLVAQGLNYSAAYRQSYVTDEMAPNTVWREAHRLSQHKKVSARISQLVGEREEENRRRAATRTQRVLCQLEAIMVSGNTDTARLRAAEMLGKTVGLFHPETKPRSPMKSVYDLEQELAALLKVLDKGLARPNREHLR